jgi:hypothetical protein
MATYSKIELSGNPADGRQIKIVATSTAGTTIHDADASAQDEIHLWAHNSDSEDRVLTIEWGGVVTPDDIFVFTVPAQDGWYPIAQGWILTGSKKVAGFAAAANVIIIQGFVNRIT